MENQATAEVAARAALAGNPSDGYRGAVMSVPLPHLRARVTASVQPGAPAAPLTEATLRRFEADTGIIADPIALAIDTTIPRSVGLAGSSAIAIATIRALAALTNRQLTDEQIAVMAHTVERVDMGIAGGWQDQIVQTMGDGPLHMDFGTDAVDPPCVWRTIEAAAPLPAYVAWATANAEDSGVSHATLRRRDQAGETDDVWPQLAQLAHDAARAIETGDSTALAAAIDATFDHRQELMDLHPDHVLLVDTARELGACANYAGSGGAIAGLLPPHPESFIEAMQAAGYEIDPFVL